MSCVVSEAGPTLYSLKTDSCFVVMLVYGDGILMFSDMEQGFDFIIGQFKENLENPNPSKIEIFLGLAFNDMQML